MATLKDMEIGALINLSENHNKQTKNVEEKDGMSQIVGIWEKLFTFHRMNMNDSSTMSFAVCPLWIDIFLGLFAISTLFCLAP